MRRTIYYVVELLADRQYLQLVQLNPKVARGEIPPYDSDLQATVEDLVGQVVPPPPGKDVLDSAYIQPVAPSTGSLERWFVGVKLSGKDCGETQAEASFSAIETAGAIYGIEFEGVWIP